jgi:hypothetical protein
LSVYDAGAQILANAFDWLLPQREKSDPFTPPRPGTMDNPYLGIIMLTFICIGVVGFDGFMGVSYFASIFVPSVMPTRLFKEAFSSLHSRMGLPPIAGSNMVSFFDLSPLKGFRHSQESGSGSGKSKSSEGGHEGEEELEPFFDEIDHEETSSSKKESEDV